MVINVQNKMVDELKILCDVGLICLYIGFEIGDDAMFKRIVKGFCFVDYVEAVEKVYVVGMELSFIVMFGVVGVERF